MTPQITPLYQTLATPDKARIFDTLTTKKQLRGNLCIQRLTFFSFVPSSGIRQPTDAQIKTALDDSKAWLYGLDVDDSAYDPYLDKLLIFVGTTLQTVRDYNDPVVLEPGDHTDLIRTDGPELTISGYTTRATAAGYLLVNRPNPYADSNPDDSNIDWMLIVSRNLYRSGKSATYKVRTSKGYCHAGHAWSLHFLTGGGGGLHDHPSYQMPIETLTTLAEGPETGRYKGQMIEVPFPDPAVHGYPVIGGDPYTSTHPSAYLSGSGVINTLGPVRQVEHSTDDPNDQDIPSFNGTGSLAEAGLG